MIGNFHVFLGAHSDNFVYSLCRTLINTRDNEINGQVDENEVSLFFSHFH